MNIYRVYDTHLREGNCHPQVETWGYQQCLRQIMNYE